MFHDLNLHSLAESQLLKAYVAASFELTDQANTLLMMVRFYQQQGYTTLPVAQIKRETGWGADKWRHATKGNPKAKGHRSGGLEALGVISETRFKCPTTGKIVTQWLIGELTLEAVDQLKEDREKALSDAAEADAVANIVEAMEVDAPDLPELGEDEAIYHEPTLQKHIAQKVHDAKLQCAAMAKLHGQREYKRGYSSGICDAGVQCETWLEFQKPDPVFPNPTLKEGIGAGKTQRGGSMQ